MATRVSVNPDKAAQLIRDMRATMAFARIKEPAAATREDVRADGAVGRDVWVADATPSADAAMQASAEALTGSGVPAGFPDGQWDAGGAAQTRTLTIPLVGGQMVLVRMPVPLTKENFDLIKEFLDTFERSLVEEPLPDIQPPLPESEEELADSHRV